MFLIPVALVVLAATSQNVSAGWLEAVAAAPEAPALRLPDIGGGVHDLNELSGTVVLVNFWATWCPPCLDEMRSIMRLRERMDGRKLVVLGVSVDEPVGRVRRFREQLGLDFPLLMDRHSEAYHAWKVKVYPSSFLIDETGRIRFQAIGPIEWDDEEAMGAVNQLLEEDHCSENDERTAR